MTKLIKLSLIFTGVEKNHTITMEELNRFQNFIKSNSNKDWYQLIAINDKQVAINLKNLCSFEYEEISKKIAKNDLIKLSELSALFQINAITIHRLCPDSIVKVGKISKASLRTALDLRNRLDHSKHEKIPTEAQIRKLFGQ